MKSNVANKYRIVKNGLNEFAVQMKKVRDWGFRVTGLQAEILKFPTKQSAQNYIDEIVRLEEKAKRDRIERGKSKARKRLETNMRPMFLVVKFKYIHYIPIRSIKEAYDLIGKCKNIDFQFQIVNGEL